MTIKSFTKSASYYDSFYKMKNYKQETKKIHSLIQQVSPRAKTLIDLGCGTGTHAIQLTKLGYAVTGVDTSAQMIRVATEKIKKEKLVIPIKRRNIAALGKVGNFDVAISLFHVVSYITKNTDIMRMISSVYKNLAPKGVFIFDVWYGPGVQHSPPEIMTRSGKEKLFTYQRTKIPVHDKKHHIVRVTHKTHISYPKQPPVVYDETHTLRYFFYEEMRDFLKRGGFTLMYWGDINNHFQPPPDTNWSTMFVAQKSV